LFAVVVDDEFENELTLESNDDVDDESGKCGKALNEEEVLEIVDGVKTDETPAAEALFAAADAVTDEDEDVTDDVPKLA